MKSRIGLAALATLALTACVSSSSGTTEPCADPSAGWKLSQEEPENADELLALKSGGEPVGEQLRSSIPLTEAWFADGSDRLLVCRYEAHATECPVALTVEFTRKAGGWAAGPVESRLCR